MQEPGACQPPSHDAGSIVSGIRYMAEQRSG
jgi:hypothetical protein